MTCQGPFGDSPPSANPQEKKSFPQQDRSISRLQLPQFKSKMAPDKREKKRKGMLTAYEGS